MNRRDFFRRLTVGGIGAAVAVREFPFRVFSFPSEIKIAPSPEFRAIMADNVRVRFIRAYDPAQSKMLNRWDVLYGFMTLDEARSLMPINTERVTIASPEEAEKLGLMNAHVRKVIQDASDKMEKCASENGAEDFETTAIAHPRHFIDCYEVGVLGTAEEA